MTNLKLVKICGFLLVMLIACQQGIGVSRFCGDKLTEVLDVLCETGFNHKFKKSQIANNDFKNDIEDDDFASPFGDFPLMGGLFTEGTANMLAKTRRRRMNGIAYECCEKKGCTVLELLTYCN
ncbi:LIRP-like [Teleopsis dalmanni]|uniref:LIRP-like n=1 Tax=Teleopsis dalmanni TaxID=139649 RepID=UPI0018CD2BED|nr:LIRP-like [Teleopsis dalmanni]